MLCGERNDLCCHSWNSGVPALRFILTLWVANKGCFLLSYFVKKIWFFKFHIPQESRFHFIERFVLQSPIFDPFQNLKGEKLFRREPILGGKNIFYARIDSFQDLQNH